MHDIIFEAETTAGRAFDIILIVSILLSVIVVFLSSVEEYDLKYGSIFHKLEWGFTILFTIEYVTRIWTVNKPWKYVTSFFGVIDLLSIIPTYLSIIIGGAQTLLVIRVLRMLRIFRILKLGHYVSQSQVIIRAVRNSREKLIIFISFILVLVTIIGTVLYLVESGADSGFTSIPRSIYWAIVTLTTVGYGDIAPQTELGQVLAAIIMLMGYAIIAVPTGIVSSEFIKNKEEDETTVSCPSCGSYGHSYDAKYCKHCGSPL